MRPNEASYEAIGAAMTVHSALGPRLLDSAYEKALCYEFSRQKLHYRRQVRIRIDYHGAAISPAYRIDFVLEDGLVIEIKCVACVLPVHRIQLLSYLRFSTLPLGLLLNFKAAHLRDGIHRLINAPEKTL
jgi:GxxExxY protein